MELQWESLDAIGENAPGIGETTDGLREEIDGQFAVCSTATRRADVATAECENGLEMDDVAVDHLAALDEQVDPFVGAHDEVGPRSVGAHEEFAERVEQLQTRAEELAEQMQDAPEQTAEVRTAPTPGGRRAPTVTGRPRCLRVH